MNGEGIEIADKVIPREIVAKIANNLGEDDLKNLGQVSSDIATLCQSLKEKKEEDKMEGTGDLTQPEEVIQELPELMEVMDPKKAIPAMLTTTIQQDTVFSAHGSTYTVPENTQILVPVLPESMPLIAKVPDVVTEKKSEEDKQEGEATEVVKISQVLPGYAPSYASDYMPHEVNNQSFANFANTISFNVSRYPTLAAVTDSNQYNKNKNEDDKKQEEKEEPAPIVSTQHGMTGPVEYIPAEYMKGPSSNSVPTVSVSTHSISVVKPDVLSSGRILTNMTPFPVNTIVSETSREVAVSEKQQDQTEADSGAVDSKTTITHKNGETTAAS